MKTSTTQILQASVLGTLAFKNGAKCVPAWDKELMVMIAGRMVGETPKGEANSISIMKAWSKAWHAANLAEGYSACKMLGYSESNTLSLLAKTESAKA